MKICGTTNVKCVVLSSYFLQANRAGDCARGHTKGGRHRRQLFEASDQIELQSHNVDMCIQSFASKHERPIFSCVWMPRGRLYNGEILFLSIPQLRRVSTGKSERLLTQLQQNRDLNNMCVVIGVVAPCASVWYDVESYMHRTMMLSASMSCNEQRGGVRFTCLSIKGVCCAGNSCVIRRQPTIRISLVLHHIVILVASHCCCKRLAGWKYYFQMASGLLPHRSKIL